MNRFLLAGSISGFISVLAGAFGAHALRSRISPEHLVTFETGARYQMYHALALLAVAWLVGRAPSAPAHWAGRLFGIGTVLFSGSLYLIALTGVTRFGLVTPFGGAAFLAGWVSLALAANRV